MKLDKFFKLKNDLETFSFEKNFNPLSSTLYYFSFLGNFFLILFSYFFIKDVTKSIPNLFPGQDTFFSIFIILFMIGYELFKRFAFEQLTQSVVKFRKFTTNVALGTLVSIILVSGSFYLSLKGSHRLIDTREIISVKTDSSIAKQTDSIAKYYAKEIKFYRSQWVGTSTDRRYRDSIVASLEETKDAKIKEVEQKLQNKAVGKEGKIEENNFAFAIMVFFLELIILIGVSFSSYYQWTSYTNMKKLLMTPKFKQLELNLSLLKLYYQNGRKKEQDPAISKSKLVALARGAKLQATVSEINAFATLCDELEIISGSKTKKLYNVDYERAKNLLEINHE
jgi:hypothetical protein